MPKISYNEAITRVQHWNQIRLNKPSVINHLSSISHFETDSEFNMELFSMESVLHLYLGVDLTSNSDHPELQLLLLGRNADANAASGESTPNQVYVFSTKFKTQTSTQNTAESDGNVEHMDVQMADALITFWNEQYTSWVEDVIKKGDGPPNVFDTPLEGLDHLYHQSEQYNNSKKLFVFFGLRGIPYPALDIDLIFTPSADLEQLNHTETVRDFTSPKPPFGTSGIASYSLLGVSFV